MRMVKFFILVFIFALLEVTFLELFKFLNVKPDLLLITIVIASFTLDLKWALVLSLFAGILKEVLAFNQFGISMLLFPMWSFLIIKLSKKVSLDNAYLCSGLILLIVVCNDIIKLTLLPLAQSIPFGIFLRIVFLELLYTTFILLLVSKFTKTVFYRIGI